MWRYLLLLIAGMLFLGGCTNNLTKIDQAGMPDNIIYGDDSDLDSRYPPVQRQPATSKIVIWQQLIDGFQLDEVQHPSIEKEIRQFSRRTDSLQRQLGLARPYLFHLLQEIEKYDMPTEIALLPGIESGYRGNVFSRHGAAGIWQFMPATGTYFGLKQDAWYDMRQDFPKATDAALLYLSKLYQRFDNDWLLAIAAYNGGGGTVARAIRKNLDQDKPIDFWSLDLSRETETYVPRLLALARVIGHAQQYGMKLPDIDNRAHFASVSIDKQLDLKVAAELAGISTRELLKLNPGCKRWATHPVPPHDLLLPVDRVDAFRRNLASLPAEQWMSSNSYRIAPGDNLARIARTYGVSIEDLQQANNLPDSYIRSGDMLSIPTSKPKISSSNNDTRPDKKVCYQVVHGDSLYRIARQFSVQVSDLIKWNSLNGTFIKPGQRLTVLINQSDQALKL